MLFQPAFVEPIRSQGSLFLCYCFIASLTSSQVHDAFNLALTRGWVTSQAGVRVPHSTIVKGLCGHFLTPKIDNVRTYRLADNHWVVVNKAGDIIYDPWQPLNNDEPIDNHTLTIEAELYEGDLVDKIEEHVGRPLTIRKTGKFTADGGIWVTGRAEDLLFSAYFHNKRRHCAFVRAGPNGRISPGVKEWVEPGEWSIAYVVSREDEGNTGFYEIEDLPAQANIFTDFDKRHQITPLEDNKQTVDAETIKVFDEVNITDMVKKIEHGADVSWSGTKSIADGGIWVRGYTTHMIFSAYWHNARRYRVFVRPGKTARLHPETQAWAEPRTWVFVATVKSPGPGNKAFYELED